MNKCINCGYFLNCKEAESHKENCNKYVKAQRVINKE